MELSLGGQVKAPASGRWRVLVVSLSDLAADPRVERQIACLRHRHEVITAGFEPSAFPEFTHVELPRRVPRAVVARRERSRVVPDRPPAGPGGPRTLRRMAGTAAVLGRWHAQRARRAARGAVERSVRAVRGLTDEARDPDAALEDRYWGSHPLWDHWRSLLDGVPADVVLVNDLLMLPVAFRLRSGAPVVFDAHEHVQSQNGDDPAWRRDRLPVIEHVLSRYLPRVAGMMCVGPGIAERYADATGVTARVVTNAPPFADLEPGPVDPEAIRIVYFGVAHPQRRLDLTIEAIAALDERFWLDLYLIGREDLVARVREWAAPHPRVRVLDPVPMRDIVRVANRYDVGVNLLPLDLVNHRLALPNKFFDYVQGRLAVAIGPSPEMARIAREWDFGLIAEDFTAEALARAIGTAGADRIQHCKRRAHDAARALNAEANAATITDVVDEALSAR